MDYRARRQLCADPQRLLAAVRAGRLLAYELPLAADLPPGAVPDELLARMFWHTDTARDLRLAAPPVGWSHPATVAVGQHRLEDLPAAATPTLFATQAVLETNGRVHATGPLTWSPSAAGSAAPGGAIAAVWSRPVQQDQDWSDGEDGIALSAALAGAEEDLTEHAFQPWLWRWLNVNYGICDTDENAFWLPTVSALRTALTDSDRDPCVVRHAALAEALRHTTRRHDGTVQGWRMLQTPRAEERGARRGRPCA